MDSWKNTNAIDVGKKWNTLWCKKGENRQLGAIIVQISYLQNENDG